ncbi:MAG: hypothetical protein IKK57_11520 [Clostridia bacterium]|nr:hypothetical protein [Clostridia bacterium]
MTEYTTPLCKQGEGSCREQWPLMLLGMPLFGAAAVYFIIDSLPSVMLFIFSLPLILPCAYFSIGCFLELQQYLGKACITAEGVTVTRPLARPQVIRWEDVRQVCICLYNRRMGEIGGHGHPQLVFVLPGAKKNLFDRWKTHSAFQHRKLIAIDYDEQIDDAIRKLCPLEIVDLRDTPPYK